MQKIELPNGVEITRVGGLLEVAVTTSDALSELDVRTSNEITSIATRLFRFPMTTDEEITVEVVYRRRNWWGSIIVTWRKVFVITGDEVKEDQKL